MGDYEDPGWRAATRGVGWFVFPMAHLWMWRQRTGELELLSLRRICLSLVASLFLFFIAFAFIAPWDGGDEGWIPIAVFALGVYSLIAVLHLNRRALSTQSPKALAMSYRARFFISVGFAESAAMFGICGILIGGSLWIYLVGLPFALASFTIIAPTRANIERKQSKIRETGSSLSLGEALLAPVEADTPVTGTRAFGSMRMRL